MGNNNSNNNSISSNSSSARSVKDEDLSPQLLSQTSVDDKAWLAVTDESLLNETFTREKYYMLDSRLDIDSLDSWDNVGGNSSGSHRNTAEVSVKFSDATQTISRQIKHTRELLSRMMFEPQSIVHFF
jgi:hypothetical protein